MKTMKQSEKDILLDGGKFLLHYFQYLMEDTDNKTLLMKILGLYEIQIGANVMTFLVTENMLGSDKDRIYRCYDLKGSTFGRHTKLT